MADILYFPVKASLKENVIVTEPIEFRVAPFTIAGLAMVAKEAQLAYEEKLDSEDSPCFPAYLKISGTRAATLWNLFKWKGDKKALIGVYELACLMECLTTMQQPVLRSYLLRRVYERVKNLQSKYRVSWHINEFNGFLLPLPDYLYMDQVFRMRVESADNLKLLYSYINQESIKQFQVLSDNFVFYMPMTGVRR